MAQGSPRRRKKDQDDTARPVLITSARKPYEEELADRKRRYFLLMSLRIPALVIAAIAYVIWNNGWISLAIIAGSIPIPWIAVLGANDRPKRGKHEPRGYAAGSITTAPLRPQLGPSGVINSDQHTPSHAANPPRPHPHPPRTHDHYT